MKKFYFVLSLFIISYLFLSCGKSNSLNDLPESVSYRTVETFYATDSSYTETQSTENVIIKDYDSLNNLVEFIELENGKDTTLWYKTKEGTVSFVSYKGSVFDRVGEYTWENDVMDIHFNHRNLVEEMENYDFEDTYAFSLIFDYDEYNFYTMTSSETEYEDNIAVSSNIHSLQYDKDSLPVCQNIMRIKNITDTDGNSVSKSVVSYSKNVIEYIRRK